MTTDKFNEKYKKINDILRKDGKLNSAITKLDVFKHSNIYKYIHDNSKELDIFDDILISERVDYIINNRTIENCKKCGNSYIYFTCSQRNHSLCSHKQNMNTTKLSDSQKEQNYNKKIALIESLQNTKKLLTSEEFNRTTNYLFNKPNNYAFLITDKLFNYYHDLLLKTQEILPINTNNLNISNRIYIDKYNVKEIPKCKFCINQTKFINRKIGYNYICEQSSCRSKNQQDKMLELYGTKFINTKLSYDGLLQNEFDIPMFTLEEYSQRNTLHDKLKFKCKKCNNIFETYHLNGKHRKCPICFSYKSSTETEIYNFIKSIYCGEIIENTKNIIPPYEIDLFIKDLNIAIEVDGVYWHGEENGKSPSYHINKTNMCKKCGINLIHIFDTEWITKQDIVKSRLKKLLSIRTNTIYARKCDIRKLTNNEIKEFINDNHIQGYVNSSVCLGLYYNDELVCCMTFSKTRFSKKYEWELVRFCNKINYTVIGGASKLLTYFEKHYNPTTIITYADRRWSCGDLYYKLGFQFQYLSKPNYWYYKNSLHLESRVKYQKHKLHQLLPTYDKNKSEVENMRLNGYYRIFDCGNLVFIKNVNKKDLE